MIDWTNLFFNALWIFALAIGLACLSYASYEASDRSTSMRTEFGRPGVQLFINVAGLLFCVGLAGTSDRTLEIVLWGVLAFLFLIQLVYAAFNARRQRQGG